MARVLIPRVGRIVLAVIASVALSSIAVAFLEGSVGVPDASSLYVVAVAAIAIRFGIPGAILTAVASVLVYDFLFVNPLHTLTVSDPRRGYVAVSISYRLLSSAGCGATPGPQCPVAALAAQHDAQAAVRWLRANADRYRIDPKRIAIGGTSAGAVTALLVGTRGREDPGTSGNPGHASSVKAVVSLAGGLPTNATINTGDAPTQFFHGTADRTVPFAWAQSNAFAMLAAGVPMNFQAFGNVGHNVFGAQRARIVQQSSYFLYNMLDLRTLAGSASAARAKRAATHTWSGTGDLRLGTITVAEPSILRWRVERGPLAVSAEDGRLRASGVRRSGTALVPAGTLRDVELRTPGRWRIELRPRSASPAR